MSTQEKVVGPEGQPQVAPNEKFGTFLGVYTPSVLTILGLIMYLRFGWVVGNAGLASTITIVLLASSITLITALSASAVATNMRVGVGGEYYMISRSLGLELGGALGIPLYLSRTLSITFYSFGLAESLVMLWPADWQPLPEVTVQVLAGVTIVLITAVAGKSAALALKLQIPIMIAVGASIFALAAGVLGGDLRSPELGATYSTAPAGFWYVFAVFFPAVTGFSAGIGMSGDLKDSRRSIPRGTILAVLTGIGIYLAIPVLLAVSGKLSQEQLADPSIAIWPVLSLFGVWLIYPGIWGAILSSAFGSILGGPRVLQALATDGIAPRFLARLSPTGQPTVATWLSGGLALCAVALGGLNTIAQFVTILFLTLYVMINLCAGLEQLVGDPSYRPTIRMPWYLAFAGALGAILVMFLISREACVVAVVFELLLYLHLRRRRLRKQWGDVRAGVWLAAARYSLLKLRNHESDPRNWRPHILVFVGDTKKRIGLVRMANWFNQNCGVVTACQLVIGDLQENKIDTQASTSNMNSALAEHGLVAFSEVNVVPEFEAGVIGTAQANGIAGLHSNTIMFGWTGKRERLESRLRVMRALSGIGKSTLLVKLKKEQKTGSKKRIDLWWGGLENNGDMMLLLAYLLGLNTEWRDARLVVRSIVNDETEKQKMTESLIELIPDTRINAETEIIVRSSSTSVVELIHSHSRDAEIVFLGLKDPDPGSEAEYADRLADLAGGLQTTVFVRNASEFAGNLI